jgi:hypothetical protein
MPTLILDHPLRGPVGTEAADGLCDALSALLDLDERACGPHRGRIAQLYPDPMVCLGKRGQVDRLVDVDQNKFS